MEVLKPLKGVGCARLAPYALKGREVLARAF
jgi:hypothetical protein